MGSFLDKFFMWWIKLIFNLEENKLRGSFVNAFAFIVLYSAFTLSLYLIWYSVIELKQPLFELTNLVLGVLTAMSAQLSWCFNVWYKAKSKDKEKKVIINKDEKSNNITKPDGSGK